MKGILLLLLFLLSVGLVSSSKENATYDCLYPNGIADPLEVYFINGLELSYGTTPFPKGTKVGFIYNQDKYYRKLIVDNVELDYSSINDCYFKQADMIMNGTYFNYVPSLDKSNSIDTVSIHLSFAIPFKVDGKRMTFTEMKSYLSSDYRNKVGSMKRRPSLFHGPFIKVNLR